MQHLLLAVANLKERHFLSLHFRTFQNVNACSVSREMHHLIFSCGWDNIYWKSSCLVAKFILRRFLSGTETETETKSLLRLCFCIRTKISVPLRFCFCFCFCIRIFFVFVQIFRIRPFPAADWELPDMSSLRPSQARPHAGLLDTFSLMTGAGRAPGASTESEKPPPVLCGTSRGHHGGITGLHRVGLA